MHSVGLCLLCVCWLGVTHVHGKLVGAFVLPHGGVALDPSNFNTTNSTAQEEARQLHKECMKVGEDIRNLQPEVIFLSTPHGIADYRNFLLYMNTNGTGFGVVDDCLHQPCSYNLSVTMDTNIAQSVMDTLGYDRNVSGLSGFGPLGNNEPFPLRWGEVIPLLFIPNVTASKIVVISQPTRRYTDDVSMIPELLKLGRDIFPLLENIAARVAVVVSADLAHTHDARGPYGYSNYSQPFDDACGEWASTLEFDRLLVTAAMYVDRALSCGYTGLVMLHGMLSSIPLSSWQPHLYANLHPSYYGMMAASFHRVDPLDGC